jgi:hypothetical protein
MSTLVAVNYRLAVPPCRSHARTAQDSGLNRQNLFALWMLRHPGRVCPPNRLNGNRHAFENHRGPHPHDPTRTVGIQQQAG